MNANKKKEELLPLTFKEKLGAIPGALGIHTEEHAKYEVVEKINDIEIRSYAPCTQVQVEVSGTFDDAKDLAFTKLANYLHGKNHGDVHMEMTTPVLNGRAESGGGWKMVFFIPKDFASQAPAPLDPEVTIHKLEARLMAALPYTGNVTEEKMIEKNSELLNALMATDYRPSYAPHTAQYDQPFAVPFLKTNEAMVEVTQLH